jgi:hypothetical protein
LNKPLSKAAQVRQAERILTALLRTPKTRDGLVAAVKTKTITRNYVYGFLAEGRRKGSLTTLKSGHSVMFQITSSVVEERAVASVYPSWLDPRALPASTTRLVVVDGEIVKQREKEEDQK